MRNLISILQLNGTGLLSGLCRCISHSDFDTYHKTDGNEIKIAFSLNEQNLGTFKIFFDMPVVKDFPPQTTKGYSGLITSPEVTKEKLNIWVEVCWEDGDFGYFRAVLQR